MSVRSGIHTILLDRRLPYRVDRAIQQVCRRVGLPERVISADGLRFRTRRLTSDEDFVRNVVAQREYLPAGVTIGPADTVIDIGGNIGTFAVLASTMAPQGHVLTIEPEPNNLRLLHQNIALNRRSNISVIEAAVSDMSGSISLRIADEGGFHSLSEQRLPNAPTHRVRSVTLAEVFQMYDVAHCHFLKIDCEGAEFRFLPTLPPAIWQRIDQIAMEYHTPRIPEGDVIVRELLALMRSRGLETIHHIPFATGGHYFARRH